MQFSGANDALVNRCVIEVDKGLRRAMFSQDDSLISDFAVHSTSLF